METSDAETRKYFKGYGRCVRSRLLREIKSGRGQAMSGKREAGEV